MCRIDEKYSWEISIDPVWCDKEKGLIRKGIPFLIRAFSLSHQADVSNSGGDQNSGGIDYGVGDISEEDVSYKAVEMI